eukprot:9483981-Prorocentrum_lima.AAC.1
MRSGYVLDAPCAWQRQRCRHSDGCTRMMAPVRTVMSGHAARLSVPYVWAALVECLYRWCEVDRRRQQLVSLL